MNKGFMNLIKDDKVQGWLIGIGTACLFASVVPSGLPTIWRIGLIIVTLVCFLLTFPRTITAVKNFVISFYKIIQNLLFFFLGFILCGIILYLIYITLYNKSDLPQDLVESRQQIIDILVGIPPGDTESWFGETKENLPPQRKFIFRGYELLVTEQLEPSDRVLRTYSRNGVKIAEDVSGLASYQFSRLYYLNGCNFSTDYFDSDRRFVYSTYMRDWEQNLCKGHVVVIQGQPLFQIPIFSTGY